MGRYRQIETEEEVKSFDARIWWAFWIIALIVLIYTAWHQYREYDLVHNGNCIIAEYTVYNDQELATYYDETGRVAARYNISGLSAVHENDTIKMYYKTNINAAEPHRSVQTWLISYAIFGTAFVLCSIKLRKIYKENHEVYGIGEDY